MSAEAKIQMDDEPVNEGWRAQLQLRFEQQRSRTVMADCRHYGPLRVQRPFYPEQELAHVYILHPPGGVVGGDQLKIELQVDRAARVLCTTPGSGKFYLSAGDWARLEQRLHVKSGASLEWLPQENILFDGARLYARTSIVLEDSARFIGWDINCLGRPTRQERFEHGEVDSRLAFYHNQKLILVENMRVLDSQSLDAAAGLRRQPLQGALLAYPCDEKQLECVRAHLAEDVSLLLSGVTLIDGLLVLRLLGNNGEMMKQKLVSVWRLLRPLLLERPAVLPRIWAT